MHHFLSVFRCLSLVTAPTSRGTGITTGRRTATLEPLGRPACTALTSKRRSSISSPRRERSHCTCDTTTDPHTWRSTDWLINRLTDVLTDLLTEGLIDRSADRPADHSPLNSWAQEPATSRLVSSWVWLIAADGSTRSCPQIKATSMYDGLFQPDLDRNQTWYSCTSIITRLAWVRRPGMLDCSCNWAATFLQTWITCGQSLWG